MPTQDLLERLRRFNTDQFPRYRAQFRDLVEQGQKPGILFIGCSDSRVLPHLLTGAAPGELFQVRNVAAFVPPCDGSAGYHGTAAAIEFAVQSLGVQHIIVCGHSHCGGIRSLYADPPEEAPNLRAWLELGREAMLPLAPGPEVLRRTEERSVILQLERLMDYPMVRQRAERGTLALHGWHYVIEDGEVNVFDMRLGRFIPAREAEHCGDGPYCLDPVDPGGPIFNEIDEAWAPAPAAARAPEAGR